MKISFIFILLFILSGCGSSEPETTASSANVPFTLQCDLSADFTPVAAPIISPGTGTPKTTVIALHGKNGTPIQAHMQRLQTDLNAQGYDTVMPYMPWSNFKWTGTLCDSISYINKLVIAEQNNNKSVIVLGHSLAGPIVLAYSALSNTTKPDAIAIIAPGHYPNLSPILAEAHAPSIKLAKDMIANGQGNTTDTFQTYNLGGLQDIATTPLIYLSFHDTKQFPSIESTIPRVKQPMLWLAGKDDRLTSITADTFGLIDLIPNSPSNLYKEINGDHFTVLSYVAAELTAWFSAP